MKKSSVALVLLLLFGSQAWADGPREHIVRVITDYDNLRLYFSPKTIVIAPGDTVTWVNEVEEDHNMVAYPDGYPKRGKGFASPVLKKKGEKWSQTFLAEGTYEYHCIPHLLLGMHGSVIVGRSSRTQEFHEPDAKEVAVYRRRLFEFFSEDDLGQFFKPTNQRLKTALKTYTN